MTDAGRIRHPCIRPCAPHRAVNKARPLHRGVRRQLGSSLRAVATSRAIGYAAFCQGPYEESSRYRDFRGYTVRWYSVPQDSVDR